MFANYEIIASFLNIHLIQTFMIAVKERVSLEERADCYRLEPVKYCDGFYRIDLGNDLLDQGYSRATKEWGDFTRAARRKGNLGVGTISDYYMFFSELYALKDQTQASIVEGIRHSLQKFFEHLPLTTLSKVVYTPTGHDVFIPDVTKSARYHVDFKGFGGVLIKPTGEKGKIYEGGIARARRVGMKMLGITDTSRANTVFKFITGLDTFVLTEHLKPAYDVDRAVDVCKRDFLIGGYRLVIRADTSVTEKRQALGIRVEKI